MIEKIIRKYKTRGGLGIITALYRKINPVKVKSYSLIKEIVSKGKGIEIGGTSPIFSSKGILSVYPYIKSLDNCNFSDNTIWEGEINKDAKYHYDISSEPGKQYILEATDLHKIENESYDFFLSSHMIEHTANPIKALKEWMRVVKVNGYLILLIPHKDGTFDHKRPVTSLEHFIHDYANDITEEDLTHMEEILKLHDLKLDPEAGSSEEFIERSKNNFANRCFHHHVFTSISVVKLMDYLGLNIKVVEAIVPNHILIIAQKLDENLTLDNTDILDYVTSMQFDSPFISDKVSIYD
jgi:SAM-dependent methyltransferase